MNSSLLVSLPVIKSLAATHARQIHAALRWRRSGENQKKGFILEHRRSTRQSYYSTILDGEKNPIISKYSNLNANLRLVCFLPEPPVPECR